MLQLNYVAVSSKELSKTEKLILACKGEDFGAILFDGVLKVNKDLKKPKKLEKIIRKVWEYDHLLTIEDSDTFDRLYTEVCTTWGKELWEQIYEAWSRTLRKSLADQDERNAVELLEQYSGVDIIDSICDAFPGYSASLLKAMYRVSGDVSAIFAYGFQMGAQHAGKAVAV